MLTPIASYIISNMSKRKVLCAIFNELQKIVPFSNGTFHTDKQKLQKFPLCLFSEPQNFSLTSFMVIGNRKGAHNLMEFYKFVIFRIPMVS